LAIEPWYEVLEKYECDIYEDVKKRAESVETVVPATARDVPIVDPSDPAAAYMSAPSSCSSPLSASPSDTTEGGLSGGAWVAIALAIVVGGVVMLSVLLLTYMYKSNKGVRFESV